MGWPRGVFGLVAAFAFTATAVAVFLPSWAVSETTYCGLTLGAAIEDARYRLGSPSGVLAIFGKICAGQYLYSASGHPDPYSQPMPVGMKDTDFDDWLYGTSSNYRIVRFRSGQVISIECTDEAAPRSCPPQSGIRTGESEEEVKRWLGKPSFEHLEGGKKFLRFAERNLDVWLDCNGVYSISIGETYDPTHDLDGSPDKPLARTLVAMIATLKTRLSMLLA